MIQEKVQPMRVDVDGESYTLEFDRDSVRFAESREFNVNNVAIYPQTNVPALFFYAFRKNHKRVSRDMTDKLLTRMGGLTEEQLVRLVALYMVPQKALVDGSEEVQKNAGVTVEL